MPRIRFTADPKLPRDIAHLEYRKDIEVDVSLDEANRWLRRGVAEMIADQVVEPEPAAVSPATLTAQVAASDAVESVPIPDDWEAMHHMQRMTLARRLTSNAVNTVVTADAVITAELDRRTTPAA